MRVIAFVAITMFFSGASVASNSTTGDRYEQLKTGVAMMDGNTHYSTDQAYGMREGLGWIVGIYGILMIQGSVEKAGRPVLSICPSGHVSGITMARLFVRYIDAHPAMYSEQPEVPAILSAKEAYPCK